MQAFEQPRNWSAWAVRRALICPEMPCAIPRNPSASHSRTVASPSQGAPARRAPGWVRVPAPGLCSAYLVRLPTITTAPRQARDMSTSSPTRPHRNVTGDDGEHRDVDCHVRVRDGQVSMNHLRGYFRRLLTQWVATDPDPQYSTLDGRDGLRIGDLVEEQEEVHEEVDGLPCRRGPFHDQFPIGPWAEIAVPTRECDHDHDSSMGTRSRGGVLAIQ